MGYRADVRNIHAFAGDDEFPARRHGVIARVLRRIAHIDQRGNDHIIIGVLREAQPLLGKLRTQIIQLDGRILIHAQIDLRIDPAVVQAGFQADVGQFVDRVFAVLRAAAQHHALTVIALLHTDVQIVIAVEGQEKFLGERKRLRIVQLMRIHIRLEIRVHILIETADGIVVYVRRPQRKVQNAHHLQCGKIAACAEANRAGQTFDFVAVGVGDHGVDRGAHILGRAFAAGEQTFAKHALPIAGDIAYAPLFMDVMPRRQFFPFALGVDIRKGDDRAPRRNLFIGVADDLFLLQKQLQPKRGALRKRERWILNLRADRVPAFPGKLMPECLDVIIHLIPSHRFMSCLCAKFHVIRHG